MKQKIILGDSVDPWRNLALEELIFSEHEKGIVLYLWQNQNTVVIGKNQNPWRECRLEALEQDGGKLARRSSGGGAVFHDVGNLNFTFIADHQCYDVKRQLEVIKRAVGSFGMKAEFTGRNDLVLTEGGEKFSGNAFWVKSDKSLHHGTLLIDVDMKKLGKYLAPPKEKLESKGIKSVRSRVCNLKSKVPALDVSEMKEALMDAFEREYGPAEKTPEKAYNGQALQELTEKYGSWSWLMGKSPKFDLVLEHRFAWGGIELQIALKGGMVEDVTVYSDSMDQEIGEKIKDALAGCSFVKETMAQRLNTLGGEAYRELGQWLRDTEI